MGDWKFDQAPNCAAITLKSIVFGGKQILHVTHDADDEGWQFLGLDDADEEDASVVSMLEIVTIDPTVIEVADIPPGWHAWRDGVGLPWTRAPKGG